MIVLPYYHYAKAEELWIQFRFPFQLYPTIYLSLLLFLVLLVNGCASEETTWERIESTGVLRIGLDPTYPPFEVTDGQNLWGLDVELSNALVNELGLAAEFTYFGYDGLYDALGTHQVDVLISALVVAPEKTRDFSYSESYFNAGQVLVSRGDVEMVDPSNIEDRSLAVELGSQGHVLTTRLQRQMQSLKIITFAESDLALDAVVNKDADAAVVDHVSARLYRGSQEPNLVISDQLLFDEPYAIVVRSQDKELLEQINFTLSNLQTGGQLQSIISVWLDQE